MEICKHFKSYSKEPDGLLFVDMLYK